MRSDLISRAIKKLSGAELQLPRECLDHAMTKPHRDVAELLPVLIEGHHHIGEGTARRVKAAIRNLSSEDLSWLADKHR